MNKARKAYRKRGARKPLRKRIPVVSAAVKSYVKRTIHNNIENKCVQISGGNSFGNINESVEMNAFPMCPLSGFWSIQQGVTQGTRISNQIKTRKVYLNYVLRPTQYDASFNQAPQPTIVQMYLGYVKNTPCFAPAAPDVAQLFQSGAFTTGPVGTLRDTIAVINTDYWVIKKRWTHKIGYAINDGLGAQAAAQYAANNDFKLNVIKRIDITKMVPATYQFNDSSISPTSKNLFFMYTAVATNGASFNATTLPTNIEFWVDYHFEDA